MREININIEGYNVNGICVGCLNYNRKMFYSNEVKECLKSIAEIDVPDGLAVQVCWECLAAVRATNRFQAQVIRAYDILMNYSSINMFLNAPEDLSQYAHQRLKIVTPHDVLEIKQNQPEEAMELEENELKDIEIKSEVDVDFPGDYEMTVEDQVKLETDAEYSQDAPLSEDLYQDSSEDDVSLSTLKKGKEKVDKKVKKKKKDKTSTKEKSSKDKEKEKEDEQRSSRKLKNLPKDLVELYTMSEEEMWQVRADDIESKEFAKLKYKCNNCAISFNTERLMTEHMNGKHKPKSEDCQQCDVCKAYFLTKDNLSTHRALHLTAYRCAQCGHRTTLKRNMLRHVAMHSPATEQHQCQHCEKIFSTKSKLAYHKNVCHQEKPQCDCCGKVFANKMTLKYHLKLLPQNKEEKPKEKLYIPCKGCGKVFHTKKSYRAHVVIHDGLSYPCPICGKLFQWKRNLARHTRNHRERESGALHECRECGKTFSSRDCYNNHMKLSKRHAQEDKYGHKCNYCGKKFATKWCMVDHIDWDHLKRIKYQCSVCFKAFKTAKIMVAHVNNIHEGKGKEPEGEHLCEICGKSYKTVKRLKGHVWAMHTNRSNTKSFMCKLCPATFTWQTSIYKHVKMMHGGRRGKQQSRPAPPVKKEESYPNVDLTRMQYFTHNVSSMNSIQNIAPVPTQIGLPNVV